MLYYAYEVQKNWLAGMSGIADASAQNIRTVGTMIGQEGSSATIASALEVVAHAAEARGKPAFGIHSVEVDGAELAVEESIEQREPFGQLKHFSHAKSAELPKLLIVAPMSGHYATLLRDTVEQMLPTHNVWITDWRNARDVPLADGHFDMESYIDYIIAWLEHIGADTHMLAVCQPSVPCYAATALMNASQHPCRPRTLTMMGGPIDTREAPTSVNHYAMTRPYDWFARHVITTVPAYYAGAGRRVYPGFLQLTGFLTMNLGNHLMSHWDMFKHLVEGDGESADRKKEFYDEYRSVCDMAAEFYLQTIDVVFQRHLLPKGEFTYRGERVDAAAISDTALLCVEGERDDISGIGQTKAALELAVHLPNKKKKYLLAEDTGHYGIFHGKKWRGRIAPTVEKWIATHAA